jgi:hypothetical protein
MRHPLQHQLDLHVTPIDEIRLRTRSRDELPPILALPTLPWDDEAKQFGQPGNITS